MIKLILSISILLTTNAFQGGWVLKQGSIDQSDSHQLVFEKFDPQVHSSFHEVYHFERDGSFALSVHNPQNLGFCGNGMLSINSGKWTLEGGRLRLNIEGSRLAMYSWTLNRLFRVQADGNQLILTPIGEGSFKKVNPYLEIPIKE
jgi:hypothetical protein